MKLPPLSTIRDRFDILEGDGLSETLRYEAQNCIENRGRGDMGKFEQYKAKTLRRIRVYQPRFLTAVVKIFDEI